MGGGVPGDWCYIAVGGETAAEQIAQSLPAGIRICDTININVYLGYNIDYLDTAFYTANIARFQRTYDKLQDDISKQTMTAYIEAAIGGDTASIEKLCRAEQQYFNDLTKSLDVECFVDCGAFVGDTAELAVDFYGDKLKKIIAFEPDQENIKKLRMNMTRKGISGERLLVVPKGAWSEDTTLRFSSGRGASSSLSQNGDIEIPVDSIDHVLEGARVDLIKMDIEGSEAEALRGAAVAIRSHRPALAICVYHRPDDLLVIPELIEELAGSGVYRYYLRLHDESFLLNELVLYAIPA